MPGPLLHWKREGLVAGMSIYLESYSYLLPFLSPSLKHKRRRRINKSHPCPPREFEAGLCVCKREESPIPSLTFTFGHAMPCSRRRQRDNSPLLNRARQGQLLRPGPVVAGFDAGEDLHEPDGGVARFCEGELFCLDGGGLAWGFFLSFFFQLGGGGGFPYGRCRFWDRR